MTTNELQEIKAAAQRIHAAAVAAGRWDPKPEWETCLMRIVVDIANAVEADEKGRHADLSMFDFYNPSPIEYKEPGEPLRNFESCFESFVQGTVEDCLADAVIDILDTVEGFNPEWTGAKEYQWQPPEKLMTEDGGCKPFPAVCFYLVEMLLNPFRLVGGFLNILSALKWWSEARGVDLRRHVQLKMKYNEAKGRRA